MCVYIYIYIYIPQEGARRPADPRSDLYHMFILYVILLQVSLLSYYVYIYIYVLLCIYIYISIYMYMHNNIHYIIILYVVNL